MSLVDENKIHSFTGNNSSLTLHKTENPCIWPRLDQKELLEKIFCKFVIFSFNTLVLCYTMIPKRVIIHAFKNICPFFIGMLIMYTCVYIL